MSEIIDLTELGEKITISDMSQALWGYVSLYGEKPKGISLSIEQLDKYISISNYSNMNSYYNYGFIFYGIPLYLYKRNLEEVMNKQEE